ncbi:TOMM precursor leader peptide-binding protein [Microbacterium lacticum]|uniref:TOMM precursor leader peptide-binding protein n=1 Tax=Microbacterium lacticum TaxID=33885 RepID=UPI003A884A94
MFDTSSKYVVNPSLTVVRSSDDEIIVRLGSRSTVSRRLKDDQRNGVLGNLVEYFCVPSSRDSVPVPESVTAEVVDSIIDTLVAQRILLEESVTGAAFLSVGLGLPHPQQIAEAAVGVVGTGRIAASLAEQLGDLGAEVSSYPEADAAAFESSDLVAVASDRPDLGLFFDANEIALGIGRPWHAVFVDGAECVIGPLFRPGHTACFHDYDTMDEAARSLRLDYLYYKSAIAGGGDTDLPRFIADLAASYASISIAQHLGGKGSFLEGAVMRVDVDRLEIVKDRVLQLPRCPACIQDRPHLRHPFI